MKWPTIRWRHNIGPDYLHRWRLIPIINGWYPPFNLYLHHFLKSDKGRDLHDHPFPSMSILIKGHLWEQMHDHWEYEEDMEKLDGGKWVEKFWLKKIPKWKPVYRTAKHRHRLILNHGDAWTLFFVGPKQRSWGFWVEGKFVPYWEYEDAG